MIATDAAVEKHLHGLILCMRVLMALAVVGLGGCASQQPERIPKYPWVNAETALHTLAERSARVHTVSSECLLTLTRPDGQSVRLDGALAMRLPGFVRMRAWKFGQAVFDLTLTPEGAWVVMPEDPGRKQKVLPASVSAAQLGRAWSLLSGDFFAPGPDLRVQDSGGPRFRVSRAWEQSLTVTCEIDRATLTPRRFSLRDTSGVEGFVLIPDQYREFPGAVWPTRFTARSEGGTILVELKDPELNSELPPNAFVPPRRAEKLP